MEEGVLNLGEHLLGFAGDGPCLHGMTGSGGFLKEP